MISVGASIGLTMILIACSMKDFYAFLGFFSIGFGICNGLTYMVPMNHGWLWFPERPGLISGIIIGGFGIGTFVFNLVCTAIVNPDDEKAVDGQFSEEVNERVPRMLYTLAISCVIISIASILLIFPGKDYTGKREVKKSLSRA